ncbi:MAG: hypothetical protein M3Y13_15310 [Armatimonadota bacterium]|nr:hypothetical protein [Armatimonadota bacterium]
MGRRVLDQQLFLVVFIYFAATVGQFGGYESVKRYVEEQGQKPSDLNMWFQFPPPDEE